MGLPNTKYKAARPVIPVSRLKKRIYDRAILCLFHQRFSIYVTILLIIITSILTIEVYSDGSTSLDESRFVRDRTGRRLWPSVRLHGRIDNVVVDETSGSVFFAVDSDIYKYSKNFTPILDTRESSPAAATTTSDATSSSASLDMPSSQTLGTMNKILTIIKGTPNTLISCLQVKNLNLRCLLYRLSDLKSTLLLWSTSDPTKGFKTNYNERYLTFTSPSDPTNLLLVTSHLLPIVSIRNHQKHINDLSDTNTSNYTYLSAMSRMKVSKATKFLYLDQRSVLPYRSHLDNLNLYHDYVQVFEYNNYTHFILNDFKSRISSNDMQQNDGVDMEAVTMTQHSVRVARICNEDIGLNSYTEISITCNNRFGLYARVAHLDLSKDDNPQLVVIFEPIDGGSTRKSNAKSLLCTYSMKLIEDLFYNAVAECNNGRESAHLLAKLHPESERPPICQKNPSKDWCSSKINPYIDGFSLTQPLREDSSIELPGMSAINFLYATPQGNNAKDVYFIGSETGRMTKISSDEDLLYTLDLPANRILYHRLGTDRTTVLGTNSSETPSTHFHGVVNLDQTRYAVYARKIVVTTRTGEAHLLDMDACEYYTSCTSCLSIRDPLDCVWCGTTCSKRPDCPVDQISTTICPPVIKSFSPIVGPLSGHTRIVIDGENFGSLQTKSPNQKLEVKLGSLECDLDLRSSTSEQIVCYSPPVTEKINAVPSVQVIDDYGSITINGSVQANQPFVYDEVEFYGSSPSVVITANAGHYDEVSLNFFGKNLDIGSNRTLLVGTMPCTIYELTSNKIKCHIRPKMPEGDLSMNESNYTITYLIDGHQQSYTMQMINGLNMSNVLTLRYEMRQSITSPSSDYVTDTPGDAQQDSSNSITWNGLVLLLVIIALVTTLLICLARRDRYWHTKIKIPGLNIPTKAHIEDGKVSFRNPESHKFIGSNLSNNQIRPGESLNGLVKLNGSVMSSDYFGKPLTLEQLEQDKPLISNFLDNEMLAILDQEKILIDRNRLTLGHVLGHGQFGRVYKGFLKMDGSGEHSEVAVKTLLMKPSWDESVDNRAFLEEGLMMRDFEHENVLALIGVTFDSNGLPMVITPYMLYGDLRTYISDEASSPTVKELIEFCTQVAKGMAYLSGLKFVHRDLAARNCMLDENLTVKVADFGLSRDIYERDYYSSDNKKAKLPVKWMAIESLEKSVYSTKTDVWSYGILLWELMTRGVVPYPDVDNFDLFSYLKEGRRMLRPRYCPVILYNIMLSCWQESPALRPTFDELVVNVSNVITELQEAKDEGGGQQKVSRDETYCDVHR